MDEFVEKTRKWWNESSTRKRWSSIALLIAIVCTLLFFLFSNSPHPVETSSSSSYMKDFDSPLYYFGVIAKTLGILLLIVGGAIAIKRLQKNPPRIHSDRALAVMESTRLSPKQVLHLVRVGEQYFLVGATDQSLNLISRVDPRKGIPVKDAPVAVNHLSFNEILAEATEPVIGEDGIIG